MSRKKFQKGRKPSNNTNAPQSKAREQKELEKPVNDTTNGESTGDNQSTDSGAKSSTSRTNDPAFYMKDAALATTAGSINCSQPFGSEVKTLSDGNYGNADNCNVQAGIITLTTKPTIGMTQDRNSPANVAATQLYINVRYVNSGRKNYDQQDLFIDLLAIADIYSFIMWCQRIYACAFSYSQANWYIGKDLLYAQGIDADNLLDNLAQFRYRVNAFINKVSSFAVPKDLSLFSRRAFMYSGMWIENDQEMVKDQIYMFRPDGFYYFKLDDHHKGMLNYEAIDYLNHDLLVADLYNMMDAFLANIYGDEDFGLISGDIIKAYGSGLIGLAPMPEALYAVPSHDIDALRQFQNAKVANVYRHIYGQSAYDETFYEINLSDDETQTCIPGNIYQDANGNLVCHEVLRPAGGSTPIYVDVLNEGTFKHGALVNFSDYQPDPATVLESTRLTLAGWVNNRVTYGYMDEDNGFTPLSTQPCEILSGAEIVTAVEVYAKAPRSNHLPLNLTSAKFTSNNVIGTNMDITTALRLASITQFQYAPLFVLLHYSVSAGSAVVGGEKCINSRENSLLLPVSTLQNMHECCMLSLMYAPGVAKVGSM